MDPREAITSAYDRRDAASQLHAEALADIISIRAQCQHQWQFTQQVNAYHNDLWNIRWTCTTCDAVRTDEMAPPICTCCLAKLRRAEANDVEANAEAVKPEYKGDFGPAQPWCCTNCNKLHILHVLGD